MATADLFYSDNMDEDHCIQSEVNQENKDNVDLQNKTN